MAQEFQENKMATVVLTALGTALGGPVGAAIGALAGRAFDQAVLFKPKGREGPRLAELQVQTSSYGSQLPKLFGTMRVAGTVIWATDLRETREKSGGGKGAPSVTSYSYSASFAVALSARPILSVKRIWADGNLLRGAAGDFKTELGAMRVHPGGEDQAVDPLIASAEGIGLTPAHRGIAYIMFEDLALADYGNRIPSLTFEVEADEGAVPIGEVAAALSDGAVTGMGLASVEGYAASGGDVRDALGPLVEGHDLALVVGETGIGLAALGAEAGAAVVSASLCRLANGRACEPVEHRARAADAVPVQMAVRHHDAARDYQAGVQSVARPGPGRVVAGLDMPAVLGAAEARALAARRIGVAWAGRASLTLTCGWDALVHAPGDIVTVDGEAGLWRVEAREWEAMAVVLTLRRVPGVGAALPLAASSGAIVRQVDAPHGATSLMLADLPPLGTVAASAPMIVAAASGGAGWRRASLLALSVTGEATPLGRSARRAVMGVLAVDLPGASSLLVDRTSVCEVTLLASDMVLGGADEAALAQGRNLCLVGGELMQFADAAMVGPGAWRLSGLRRGLRGTEWATGTQVAGAPFLLIEEERLFDVPTSAIAGEALTVAALGIGDGDAVEATVAVTGEAVRPPSPVHLRSESDGAGGFWLRWTRRSRAGWRWDDGVDVPLVEESELYAIDIADGGGVFRADQVAAPEYHCTAGVLAGHAGPWTLSVRQIGTRAVGRASDLIIAP
jgi:hypothetical protein